MLILTKAMSFEQKLEVPILHVQHVQETVGMKVLVCHLNLFRLDLHSMEMVSMLKAFQQEEIHTMVIAQMEIMKI